MYYADSEKWEKKIAEGIERPNQESIKTLGEMEKLQVLGNIGIRHHHRKTRWREKKEMCTSEERESFLKSSSKAKLSLNG